MYTTVSSNADAPGSSKFGILIELEVVSVKEPVKVAEMSMSDVGVYSIKMHVSAHQPSIRLPSHSQAPFPDLSRRRSGG